MTEWLYYNTVNLKTIWLAKNGCIAYKIALSNSSKSVNLTVLGYIMQGKIRVIVLGLIRSSSLAPLTGDRIFVSECCDPVKQETFYRALGGGVEFGERSIEALQREFQEEIQAKLTNIKYLACLENFFVYNGKAGHELIQLYQCDFVDRKFYELESLNFADGDGEHTAFWMPIARFRSGELRLVPDKFIDYCAQ